MKQGLVCISHRFLIIIMTSCGHARKQWVPDFERCGDSVTRGACTDTNLRVRYTVGDWPCESCREEQAEEDSEEREDEEKSGKREDKENSETREDEGKDKKQEDEEKSEKQEDEGGDEGREDEGKDEKREDEVRDASNLQDLIGSILWKAPLKKT
jgi:hypothetical protein